MTTLQTSLLLYNIFINHKHKSITVRRITMRLDKYLADMGIGTRSELKKAIRAKAVTVNGKTVRDPAAQVSENDSICWQDKPVKYESLVYYMLHKPAGVISASSDSHEKTVVDLITDTGGQNLESRDSGDRVFVEQNPAAQTATFRRDLFPVGRLDRDTEGLLLITNDGALAHRLLSPKHHVKKVYLAVVTGTVTADDISAFQNGITLEDGTLCRPAVLEILHPGETDDPALQTAQETENRPLSPIVSAVRITITEGKFHQIKRMFLACGHEVRYLKRISMGPLTLDPELPAGSFRRLTDSELEMLQQYSV